MITGRDGSWLWTQWPAKVFDLPPLTDEQTDELVLALDPRVGHRGTVRSRQSSAAAGSRSTSSRSSTALDRSIPMTTDRPTVPDSLYEPLFARLLARSRCGSRCGSGSRHRAPCGPQSAGGRLQSLSEDKVDDVIDELEDAKVFEPHGTRCVEVPTRAPGGSRSRARTTERAPNPAREDKADVLVKGAAGEPDWRLVAAHYEQAERHADAAAAYRQASANARRRGALEEARTYLTHSLRAQLYNCVPPEGRDRDRLENRAEIGAWLPHVNHAEGYQSPSVAADLERCLQLVGSDLRNDEVWSTLVSVSSYYVWSAPTWTGQVSCWTSRSPHPTWAGGWLRPAINGALGMVAFFRGEMAQCPCSTSIKASGEHCRKKTSSAWTTCGTSLMTRCRWPTNILRWTGSGMATSSARRPR